MIFPVLAALGIMAMSATPSEPQVPFRYRRALSWTDGWVATELLSTSALATASQALDLPHCPQWEAALESGMKLFVLVTQEGGPSELAVMCIFDRIGSSWELSQCYGYGMNRPIRPEQEQHVRELVAHLRRDLGKVVAERARQISDPEKRYQFLRAVVRKPTLSARVVPDQDFVDVVVETVQIVHPERIAEMEQRRAQTSFEPISSDMFVHRLPIGGSNLLPVGN
jgi:hypothetical protein